MSDIRNDEENKIEALKTVIGFGRPQVRTCMSCAWSTWADADMDGLLCMIGEKTFDVTFPVAKSDFCEKHEVDE